MLLRSSIILILVILNILLKDLKYLSIIFVFELLCITILTTDIKGKIKSLKRLSYIFILMLVTQIFYNQEGKVLLKIYNIYITENGVYSFGVIFFRVINLYLLSWLLSKNSKIINRFQDYREIIEIVVNLLPQVFTIFRRKTKIKWFFREILKKIDKKIY